MSVWKFNTDDGVANCDGAVVLAQSDGLEVLFPDCDKPSLVVIPWWLVDVIREYRNRKPGGIAP